MCNHLINQTTVVFHILSLPLPWPVLLSLLLQPEMMCQRPFRWMLLVFSLGNHPTAPKLPLHIPFCWSCSCLLPFLTLCIKSFMLHVAKYHLITVLILNAYFWASWWRVMLQLQPFGEITLALRLSTSSSQGFCWFSSLLLALPG